MAFPRLVVADADGVEVLRTTIGNERLPRARLHDFDGRRLIYTLGPNEPPGFWAVVLDLECPTCTRVLYNTRPTFYDLVGSEPAVSGRPATCSTSGLVADLDPQPDLPAPAARTRQAIFDAAMACDFPRLLALSGYEPRNALLGADGDGWIEQERRHVSGEAGGAPVLQAIVEHIDLPYEGPFGSEQLIVWTSEANELVIDAYGAWVSFGSPD